MGAITQAVYFLMISVKVFVDAQGVGWTCYDQIAPRGGRLQGNCVNARPNDVCQVYCYPGHTIIGTNPIVCQHDGTWSSVLAACRSGPTAPPSCPNQKNPRGGYLQGICSKARYNDACRVVCNAGLTLVGNNPTVCRKDGTWSSARARCTRSGGRGNYCTSLTAPTNGAINGTCANALPGDTCTLSCSSGYELSSSGSLICLRNGTWDKAVPQCNEIECEPQDPIVNGALSGDCAPGKAGEECTLLCAKGYVPSEYTISCEDDSTWSDEFPACTKNGSSPSGTCKKLIRPPNGYIAGCNRNVGGKCIFRCNFGYTIFRAPAVRTCRENGQWSGQAPSCVRRVVWLRPG